jgi:hypothetical protein
MTICYQTGAVAVNVVQKEHGSFVPEKAEDGQRKIGMTAGVGVWWKRRFLCPDGHLLGHT